jgi:PKD repeat protein
MARPVKQKGQFKIMLFAVTGVLLLVLMVILMKKCSGPTCPATVLIETAAEQYITGNKIQFRAVVDGEVQSYLWDFGDNSTPSSEAEPVHIYESVQGEQQDFTVTLTINGECPQTKVITILAAVTEAPVVPQYVRAVVDGPVGEVYVGEPVQFYDKTPGEVTSWDWSFGETMEIDSHEKNPVYTYKTKGTYTVQLMINGGKSEPGEFIVKVVKRTAVTPPAPSPGPGKGDKPKPNDPTPPPKIINKSISKDEFVKIITEECNKEAPDYKRRLANYCGGTLNGLKIVSKGKEMDFYSWVNQVNFIDKCKCNISGLIVDNDAAGDIVKITLK